MQGPVQDADEEPGGRLHHVDDESQVVVEEVEDLFLADQHPDEAIQAGAAVVVGGGAVLVENRLVAAPAGDEIGPCGRVAGLDVGQQPLADGIPIGRVADRGADELRHGVVGVLLELAMDLAHAVLPRDAVGVLGEDDFGERRHHAEVDAGRL